MNKIFKIVFNAARGKMMVVNEATSSVQTGKKAAVTVAVASALLLSANVASAASKVYGGGQFASADVNNAGSSFELTVDKGDYDRVVGGVYTQMNDNAHDGTFEHAFGSVKTVIGDGITVNEELTAGHRHAYGYADGEHPGDNKFSIHTKKTELVITGGEFTGSYTLEDPSTDGAFAGAHEQFVTLGDYIKDRGINYGNNQVSESVIDTASASISGGSFAAPVFGGTVLNAYSLQNVKMTAEVTESNINITGGTFEDNLYAGGASYNGYSGGYDSNTTNREITSHVEVANLSISGDKATFEGDIYAGGLVGINGNLDNRIKTAATVGTANIVLTDGASVKNIYGTSAIASFKNENYKAGSNVQGCDLWDISKGDDVETNVTIVNSKVTEELLVNKGSVELRVEGEAGKVSVGTLSAEGKIVTLSADGAFNDATGGNVDALAEAVQVNGKPFEVEGATVKLDEGTVMGAVSVGSDGAVVTQVNKKTEALAEQVTLAPQMIQRIMMNDVRKRMGDLRAAEGTHGVWARYNGGQMAGSGMEADFNMVQVGIDTVPVVDAPRFGVAFSYAQTEADATNGLATTDMDSFSLAFYGTKMYDNGMFVDVIGRMATMDTEMTVQGNKAEMDNVALSLSGELGWRFDVTDQFFFEPSVEATYTYTNADTFKMGQGTYELESVDSLVGRAGFAAGFKCPANKGDIYVRAAVVHEFMGDSTMNSKINGRSATPVESDGEDTYFEYAVGAQFNVNKNTYVYADVERTEGANVDEDWRANVGVRFAF